MAALAASFFAPGAAALAREKTTAHARRSTKNSTATRAAVKSDETAISKPFEVRALVSRDIPTVQAAALLFGLLYGVVGLVLDTRDLGEAGAALAA